MANSRARWILAVLALSVTALAAGLQCRRSDATAVTDSPRRTATIERGVLYRSVIATGAIRPVVGAEINVGSRISGTVLRLPVEVGDRVEAGQLLAELDATALMSAVVEARADVALSESRLTLAKSNFSRQQRLSDGGVISEEVLDTARRDFEVEGARLAAVKARLRSAEIRLGYARIVAPIRGVVAEVTTRQGETVAADFSAPTFVTLVDLERLEVLAYVDETDIGRVFVGQSASFTVDTYPDFRFEAAVVAIEPKAELRGNVVNYTVRLSFERAEGLVVRPEMTAHVRLQIDERAQALTAPRGALRRRDGRSYVWVKRAGQWVEQEVKTGWRSDTAVEILQGLQEGEVVGLNST